MWTKINEYYLKNGEWTISKTGIETVRYGLWRGSVNIAWFKTSSEAIKHFNKLKVEKNANAK